MFELIRYLPKLGQIHMLDMAVVMAATSRPPDTPESRSGKLGGRRQPARGQASGNIGPVEANVLPAVLPVVEDKIAQVRVDQPHRAPPPGWRSIARRKKRGYQIPHTALGHKEQHRSTKELLPNDRRPSDGDIGDQRVAPRIDRADVQTRRCIRG